MHNVVFDISVLVSALIIKGKRKELGLKAVTKEFNLIASREILSAVKSGRSLNAPMESNLLAAVK